MTPDEFGKIYEKRRHDWVGLAYQKLRNHAQADDAVHDALVTYIFPRLPKLTAKNMDSYVRQAIVWYIKRFIWLTATGDDVEGQRLFHNPDSFEDLDEEIVDPSTEHVDPVETATPLEQAIREALTSLSDVEQDIVTMKVFAGMSHPEIARQLALPEERVKKTYQRALTKLRLALESVGISGQPSFDSTVLSRDENAA